MGAFVRMDNATKQWHEVSDAAAREKVGQQFRENSTKKDYRKIHARRLQRRQQKQKRIERRQSLQKEVEANTIPVDEGNANNHVVTVSENARFFPVEAFAAPSEMPEANLWLQSGHEGAHFAAASLQRADSLAVGCFGYRSLYSNNSSLDEAWFDENSGNRAQEHMPEEQMPADVPSVLDTFFMVDTLTPPPLLSRESLSLISDLPL